jgi:hypothetical protein
MTLSKSTCSITVLNNDAKHNDTQYYGTQHGETLHNDNQHNDTQHTNIQPKIDIDTNIACFIVMNVVMLNVVILRVMAPFLTLTSVGIGKTFYVIPSRRN